MPETESYIPQEARNFQFPENRPVSETKRGKLTERTKEERERDELVEALTEQLQDFLILKLSGQVLQGGTKILGSEKRPPLHTDRNYLWTTMVNAEMGSIRNISELSSTPEGTKFVETFFQDHGVTDPTIQQAVKNRIGKLKPGRDIPNPTVH